MLPDGDQLNPYCSGCSSQSYILNFSLFKIHKISQCLISGVCIMTYTFAALLFGNE